MRSLGNRMDVTSLLLEVVVVVIVVVIVPSLIVIVMVAVPSNPGEFFAVRVIMCVPSERSSLINSVPVPILPSILDLQTRESPDNSPSKGSIAEPVKVISSPDSNCSPSVGVSITTGKGEQATKKK